MHCSKIIAAAVFAVFASRLAGLCDAFASSWNHRVSIRRLGRCKLPVSCALFAARQNRPLSFALLRSSNRTPMVLYDGVREDGGTNAAVQSHGHASIAHDTAITTSISIETTSDIATATSAGSFLLPTPPPNSIGNFFENGTEAMSFIQCYMLAVGSINGTQYGVGFPVDMPVMLTYFEGSELKPVRSDYIHYDHLLDHVANQLDNNDLQLYRTPVVLTLQGEFEDESFNQLYGGDELDDDDDEEEEEEEEDEAPLTLQALLDREKYFDEQDDEEDAISDDDSDDDSEQEEQEEQEGGNGNLSTFWRSSPAGKMDQQHSSAPDYSLFRPAQPDLSTIPSDALVTDQDARSLHRAHRKADRIIEHAQDVKLMASFHYRKRNFHLVRLLEPLFIIGKRIQTIKGYYFTLLGAQESEEIRPPLESMVLTQFAEKKKKKRQPAADRDRGARGSRDRDRDRDKGPSAAAAPAPSSDAKRPRRSWLDRRAQGKGSAAGAGVG